MTASIENLNTLSLAALVALYNELTGKSIKKFDSKAKGIARITPLLEAQAEAEAEAEAEAPASKRGGKLSERTLAVVRLLRQQSATIASLAEQFGTNYKNITGDLHCIRHSGEKYGVADDEELMCTRNGRTRIYALTVAADEHQAA